MGVFGRRYSIPLVDWVCMTGLSVRSNWKEAQKTQPWAGLTCMATVGAASQAAVASTAGSCCRHEDILRRE